MTVHVARSVVLANQGRTMTKSSYTETCASTGLKPWLFPTLLRPRRRVDKWRKIKSGPQLEQFQNDALESTIAEDQTLIDQACAQWDQAAAAADLSHKLNPADGSLNQSRSAAERQEFVKQGYKFVRKIDLEPLPNGLSRYWFAVTSIHGDGLVNKRELTPELCQGLVRRQQRRRRALGDSGVEIGWVDLSRNRLSDDTILWCLHVHSLVGVVADTRQHAKEMVSEAYRVTAMYRHSLVTRPLHIRSTYLNVDFTRPHESVAGWLAYASRSARASMNVQRDERVSGAQARPAKNTLTTAKIREIVMFLGATAPSNRFVLGGCRRVRGKIETSPG